MLEVFTDCQPEWDIRRRKSVFSNDSAQPDDCVECCKL